MQRGNGKMFQAKRMAHQRLPVVVVEEDVFSFSRVEFWMIIGHPKGRWPVNY